MKKINIFMLSAAATALFTLSSCGDDFLDRTPLHGYTAPTYYTSDEAVIKGIEPLYNYAWHGYNERAIVGMGSFRANDAWSPYLQGEFARFTITGLSKEIVDAWSSLYMVVTMSNQLINDIDNYATSSVSESVKNQAKGEAMLMKALSYFYIVRLWGETPIIDDNVKIIGEGQSYNLTKNTEEDMERYTFLSITLTVFWWLLRATVIVFLIVIYFAVEGNDELAKQLLIGFVVSAGTFFTMSCIASWCIYHNGTVYPINRDPNYDDSDYEFDF